MRICYIANAGSVHTQRWVKYFADKGHEVHLISPRPFGDNNMEAVKLYVLKRVRPQIRIISYVMNLPLYVIQVGRLLKRVKPDILHAHYITNSGLLGALTGFHPFVLSAWGSDVLIAPKEFKVMKWIVNYALRRADLITCGGENTKEEMTKLRADVKKVHLISHAVDTRSFSPAQKSEALRRSLKISGSPTVISIRNLSPLYDVESLVKAIPLVRRQIPEVKFIIAGDGEQKDYLEKLASSLGDANSVRFVGWIPHEELPKYLASADVYVSTSLSDGGISVSTLEAMACGLPAVITDVGDNRRWVKEGVNGFIVPVKSPNALALKIVYLLKNKNAKDRFARTNRQVVEEKANYEKEMQKMEKLYKELIGGNRE